MGMQIDQLFDTFTHILEQDTRLQALQFYIEQVMADRDEPSVYTLYEPDITNRNLEPSFCVATNNQYSNVQADTVDINDLENPLSACYVTQQTQQFDLHSRVTSSTSFQHLQKQFYGHWYIQLAPLKIHGQATPIAVLQKICRGNTPCADTLWQKKLQLLAILVYTQREKEHHNKQQQALQNQLKQTADTQWHQAQIEQIKKRYIGSDPASKKVQRGIVTASYNQLSVLIRGETGCGKDLVASQIHQMSQTPDTPFIAVNCAALPAELIEAELFGSKKGAYTGSLEDRKGLIEAAQGGILFLDEIGDMPYPLQAVLLRVLNEKTYRKVGETTERQADFRLICASNAPLEKMIEQGSFRKDLYYRICLLQLNLPPLRQHPEDLPQLAAHFIKLYGLETGQYHAPLPASLTDILQQHEWPGNVRELKNFIFTYLAQHAPPRENSPEAFAHFLDEWKHHNHVSRYDNSTLDKLASNTDNLRQANQIFEKQMIAARLKQFSGNREKAAYSLGIPKRTLAYKCKKLQINSAEAVA
jgi:sigma-54-specific transcriptional regulator